MGKVTVNKPNRPKDADIRVPGLGRFPNGKQSDVDDRLLDRYKTNHGVSGEVVIGKKLPSGGSRKTTSTGDNEGNTEESS
jgi:hypothetical protein